MTEHPRVSVVVPAYNEGEQIIVVLDRLFESVRLPSEVLVVVDTPDDTTVPVAEEYAQKEPRLKCLVNTYGRGPANAIRFGIDAASAPVVVVTMADGSTSWSGWWNAEWRWPRRPATCRVASRSAGRSSRPRCPGWPAGLCVRWPT